MQFLTGNAKKSESLYIFVSGMNKLSTIKNEKTVFHHNVVSNNDTNKLLVTEQLI